MSLIDRPADLSGTQLAGLEWPAFRRALTRISLARQEWQGIPVPLGPEQPLTLHDRHPMADLFKSMDGGEEMLVVAGGPDYEGYEDEKVVNHWINRGANYEVYLFRLRAKGKPDKTVHVKVPLSPDASMDRLTYWLNTIGASDAWDLDAEGKAMEKLAGMLTKRQMTHYCLTGSFFEKSERSGIHYILRRLRPTIALTERQPWWHRRQHDNMRCLAVLCLHPIGYYQRSWAGCMVPTDDVIAHLTMIRGDEAYFWGKANQHEPSEPQAGL